PRPGNTDRRPRRLAVARFPLQRADEDGDPVANLFVPGRVLAKRAISSRERDDSHYQAGERPKDPVDRRREGTREGFVGHVVVAEIRTREALGGSGTKFVRIG